MPGENIALSWSGGKDSNLSLYKLISEGKYEPKYLLTSVTRDYGRVSIHGIRTDLIETQASRVSRDLDIAYISKNTSNDEYEAVMREKVIKYRMEGIKWVAFGDIFLQDIREYRESRMAREGMGCIFPLWGRNTGDLAEEFIKAGFRAILCSVDSRKLGEKFAGMEFDETLLENLPNNVDPCGENGEFHTFVYDGPTFSRSVLFKKGEIVLKDNMYFLDLLKSE